MPNSNLGDLELSCLSHNSSDNNRLSLFLVIWLLGMWGGRVGKTYVTRLQYNSKVMHPLWHMERGLKTKNQVTVRLAASHSWFTFAYLSVTMNQVLGLGSCRRTANEFFWIQVFNLVNQSGGNSD